MPKKHALLSPSGGKRWLTCTPSAKLESMLPDSTSEYADEGTAAHALSELLIGYAVGKVSKADYRWQIEVIKKQRHYSVSMHDYCQEFKTYVLERYNECRAKDSSTIILIETRVDLTAYIPGGFGTADIIIISEGKLILIDLKYGQGVPVSSEENEQLMIYALGIIKKYTFIFDFKVAELHIYQPRINNTSSWTVAVSNLLKWAKEVLIPGALAASKGEGDFVPGEHCRFCRAAAPCEARKEYMLNAFKPKLIPGVITPDQVAEVLSIQADMKAWLTAVEGYALTEAVEKGTKWPGFKLVEGRANRFVKDETKVIEVLQEQKIAKSDYTKTEMLGITGLENLLGKKKFNELLGEFVATPKGKPTLVPAADKRPELNNPDSVFDSIVFDDDFTPF